MEEIHPCDVPRRSQRIRRGESTNLRDLLKVHDEEDNSDRGHRNETMTLATVFACDKQLLSNSMGPTVDPTRSQTLLEVFQLDQEPSHLANRPNHNQPSPHSNRITWKTFKSLLRLRRAAMWHNSTSSTHMTGIHHTDRPARGVTPEAGPNSHVPSRSSSGLDQDIAMTRGSRLPRGRREDGPMRVSLMALMEETSRSGTCIDAGPSFATALMGAVEEDGDNEEEIGVAVTGHGKVGKHVCCVCMVRHKGAAFIPCGHTFCRLCSRELWVSRGNCPLCNGYILEILDIF